MGKKCLLLLASVMLIFGFGRFVSAEDTEEFEHQMIDLTKEAAEVQLSLSDKGYSSKEVKEKLSPYFTDSFVDQFIALNMVKEDDGLYYVLGTDFPIYYIPFFLYEGDTWVMTDTELSKAAVYEYFPASTDGPVGYDNHYEAVVYIREDDGWKVKEINTQFNPNQFGAVAKEDISAVDTAGQSVQDDTRKLEADDHGSVITDKVRSFFQTIVSFFSL